MTYFKEVLLLAIVVAPTLLFAQQNSGIKWETGLNWEQLKEKAKQENKHIFIDCYTTWCGPCKKMDQEVYTDEVVGRYFNDKFLSVRVQMDRTKDDDSTIRSWYEDAAAIGERYMLEGYPTFLFFTPDGRIAHKESGYSSSSRFIQIAEASLTPGKTFEDLYDRYHKLLSEFESGKVNYDNLPFIITIARKLGDTVSRKILRVHENYVAGLKKSERYTRQNIEFWSILNLTPDRKIVQFFFRDADIIDKVMNKKEYSRKQVDKCIATTIIDPFIQEQTKDTELKSGVTKLGAETSYEEADWARLRNLIRSRFNGRYVKRNILNAKSKWYDKNRNWLPYAIVTLEKFKADPPDIHDFLTATEVNHLGWMIFNHIDDPRITKEGLYWMEKLVEEMPTWAACIDTYANLLYKVGRKAEAIQWEQKAVDIDSTRFQKTLEQMQNGKPTNGIHPMVTKQ